MTLDRKALANDLDERVFASTDIGDPPPRLGAEVELIPVDAATHQRCWMLPLLRRHGVRERWQEQRTAKGSPLFALPDGGAITFEPGGQVEYSSPPVRSASALLALLRDVIPPLRTAAAEEGIDLLTVGIDPYNPVFCAPLYLHTERYDRMHEYFATLHPAGARMMRQTAATQVSLDGDDGMLWPRWRLLNAAAPYFVAMFANSPIYEDRATGYASVRAEVWRTLDPARTGLPYDEDNPLGAYLDFALAAPAMLLPTVEGRYLPFTEWMVRDDTTFADWSDHLTTLFPEVRPGGRLELRSCDAIPPEWYAAPLALAVGLAYDRRSLREAIDLLGDPDRELLVLAGRLGLQDDAIARTANELVELALRGCESLGSAYFEPADLEQAETFFDRYTRRGRTLADDSADRRRPTQSS